MNNTTIVCKCGHFEEEHLKFNKSYLFLSAIVPVCEHINTTIDGYHFAQCKCKRYSPDNLLHIEMLAREKGLV